MKTLSTNELHTKSLKYVLDKSSRDSYNQFMDQRDAGLCDLVEEYGLTTACALSGWSKPTVITACRRVRPELIKGR